MKKTMVWIAVCVALCAAAMAHGKERVLVVCAHPDDAIAMAGTMFLQSKLTPSMGDPAQQKMMMWMMPLMMFFMFYSMPSALLLYWTVSQFLAIVQLMRQRKARAAAATVGADGVIEGEAITRQERRRLEREGNAK